MKKHYRYALILAIFTIIYNISEGIVSTFLGYQDENFTLFGFGIDSFIEVISGLGITHMLFRIQRNPDINRDHFERTALRITGFSFYMLVIGLLSSSLYNLWTEHKPLATFWGLIISVVSIVIMWMLMNSKIKIGKQLNSDAILADAKCTRVCIQMSFILLVSSGLFEMFAITFLDSLGSIGIAYYAFKEGQECFQKASSDNICVCC